MARIQKAQVGDEGWAWGRAWRWRRRRRGVKDAKPRRFPPPQLTMESGK